MWNHLIELFVLNQLTNNVSSSNKAALDKDLRVSWPITVELEPLSDSVIAHDIECLYLLVLERSQHVYQASCKFAHWRVNRTHDKHHHRIVFNQVVDVSESVHFLLLEQLGVEIILVGDSLIHEFRSDIYLHLVLFLVRVD